MVKKTGKWKSVIGIDNKRINLGVFETEKEAGVFYKKALKDYENGNPIKISRKKTSSKHAGVSWCGTGKKWKAYLGSGKNRISLGVFDVEEEAVMYLNDSIKDTKKGIEIKVKRKKVSSKFRGVYFDSPRNKWSANYQKNGIRKYIGRFDTEYEARGAILNYLRVKRN